MNTLRGVIRKYIYGVLVKIILGEAEIYGVLEKIILGEVYKVSPIRNFFQGYPYISVLPLSVYIHPADDITVTLYIN